MTVYKHIIAGLDLSDESPQVLNRATELANVCGATLSIAHVIEPLTFAYGGDMPVDLSEVQEQLQIKAEQELHRLAGNTDYPIRSQEVLVGQAATELHYLASEEKADLIIVGSHGRKGFALLLGSTSNSVLHGASCDVLAVRVTEADRSESR